jgi:hypothetical protein
MIWATRSFIGVWQFWSCVLLFGAGASIARRVPFPENLPIRLAVASFAAHAPGLTVCTGLSLSPRQRRFVTRFCYLVPCSAKYLKMQVQAKGCEQRSNAEVTQFEEFSGAGSRDWTEAIHTRAILITLGVGLITSLIFFCRPSSTLDNLQVQ